MGKFVVVRSFFVGYIILFNCLGYNFNIYGAFEFFMQFHC